MNLNNPAKILEQEGVVMFTEQQVPLDSDEWHFLESLANEVEYEHIVGGDTGDTHSVWVSRFINDIDYPESLQSQSDNVKDIILSKKMKKFFATFIGGEDLCLRRCQSNLLSTGDYVGNHVDQDTSPDYFASVVFYLKSEYEGGDFISASPGKVKKRVHPTNHSVLVNRGDVPHYVEPVISGKRRTLACFLSKNFGRSMKSRHAFITKSTEHYD